MEQSPGADSCQVNRCIPKQVVSVLCRMLLPSLRAMLCKIMAEACFNLVKTGNSDCSMKCGLFIQSSSQLVLRGGADILIIMKKERVIWLMFDGRKPEDFIKSTNQLRLEGV